MNPFLQMCIAAISSGRMTIEQVPHRYRGEVEDAMNESD